MVPQWRVEVVVELRSGISLKAGGFLAAAPVTRFCSSSCSTDV